MMRVVKIGGRAQSDPRLPAVLARAASRGANGQRESLCIVHGGGDEVSALQRKLGLEPAFSGGRRVTSPADLDVVRMVLSGTINKRLVALLLSQGVRAVGISGEDGMLFTARATDPATLGRVGGAVRVDTALVLHLIAGGFVPVISPLARDAEDHAGGGLNVNGDDAAAALAVALGADELVLVADVPGVLEDGALIPSLDAARAAALVASGVAAGGMAAKLEAATTALRGGVVRVRIAGLDAVADAGAGTHIVPHDLPRSPSPA
jgi:acetylglutamate kinase